MCTRHDAPPNRQYCHSTRSYSGASLRRSRSLSRLLLGQTARLVPTTASHLVTTYLEFPIVRNTSTAAVCTSFHPGSLTTSPPMPLVTGLPTQAAPRSSDHRLTPSIATIRRVQAASPENMALPQPLERTFQSGPIQRHVHCFPARNQAPAALSRRPEARCRGRPPRNTPKTPVSGGECQTDVQRSTAYILADERLSV